MTAGRSAAEQRFRSKAGQTATVDGSVPSAPELSRLLLDAKFSVPRPRRGKVNHPHLVAAARSSDCRVVAVTAPAGYGKSTFLAEWARAEDRRVAWVSLDRFDDDPGVLLTSLASALCQAGLGSADLVTHMGGPGVSVLGRAAPRLASALQACPEPFVLMLDDLHELVSPVCDDVLSLLISAIPLGSQLAAASRSEQSHLPRLRASGEALDIGASDLALDAGGARQIFANAGVSLTGEQAAAVTQRTEGWPVGLYLAALIARESDGQPLSITGDDPYVADYLYREALTRQPEDIQRFLRRTAVLDQLYGPLCDAVLGSSASARHLRHLEATSLFVNRLDRRRQWYRYHALFREFLLSELSRTEPDVIMTLHQRAADWYEANGSPELALEHLLYTADWDRSVRLTAKLSMPMYMDGHLSTVQRWFAALGDANIARYPPLAVLACYASVFTADIAKAEYWAAVVDAASFDREPATGAASFDSNRAQLRAAMCASGPEQMMADATFSLTQEAAWSPWRDSALWMLAEAYLLAGDPDEARAVFAEASAVAAGMRNWDTIPICEAQVAWLAMDRAEWQEAADRLKLALGTINAHRLDDYVFSLLAFAGAARLSLHQGDRSEAHRQLTRAMRARLSATFMLPFVAVRLRLQLAKVYLALAEPATARQLLREIDDILNHRPTLGALIGEVDEFRRVLASTETSAAASAHPLTPAELRLLPYLQTYLTADGIAERLFLSSHTVKSEIKSIYRKLGVSSRNQAVQKAAAAGLLGT